MGQNSTNMMDVIRWADENSAERARLSTKLETVTLDKERGTVAYFDPVSRAFIEPEKVLDAGITPLAKPRAYEPLTLEAVVGMTKALTGPPKGPDGVQDLNVELKVDGEVIDIVDAPVFALVSPAQVLVLLNELNRQDTLRMRLTLSRTWQLLRDLRDAALARAGREDVKPDADEEYGVFTQAELIDFLRVQIDATIEPAGLLDQLKSIKSVTNGQTSSTLDTGKFDVSRSMAAELNNAKDLPEVVTLTAAMWDNVKIDGKPLTQQVQLHLRVNPATLEFTLTPRGGQVEAGEAASLEALVTKLGTDLAGVAQVFAST